MTPSLPPCRAVFPVSIGFDGRSPCRWTQFVVPKNTWDPGFTLATLVPTNCVWLAEMRIYL